MGHRRDLYVTSKRSAATRGNDCRTRRCCGSRSAELSDELPRILVAVDGEVSTLFRVAESTALPSARTLGRESTRRPPPFAGFARSRLSLSIRGAAGRDAAQVRSADT